MDIIISSRSEKPIYEQIETQFRDMILSGRLKPGEAIPSMRMLAKNLHISLITVKKAYENLSAAGLIETVVGRGSCVARLNTELIREENLRRIEDTLNQACTLARKTRVEKDTLKELIDILYEGES